MNLSDLMDKTLRVIVSCETEEQIVVAERYVELAIKKASNFSYDIAVLYMFELLDAVLKKSILLMAERRLECRQKS